MSNISKNLLLGLTLVCVIVLIVFCIQLIVLNRGVDPSDSGSAISSGSQSNEDTEIEDEEEPDNDGEDGANGTAQFTPRPPPQGTRRELMVSMDSLLVIYSRDELFNFEHREIDWWFTYTGGGDAKLEISYIMITPIGVSAHAETFLNNYTGGTEAEFTGEESIVGSELHGYHVTALSGGLRYEAWIHTLYESDLALVFVISYENDQQRDALYEMLSTLDMIGIGEALLTGTDAAPPPDDDDELEPDDE